MYYFHLVHSQRCAGSVSVTLNGVRLRILPALVAEVAEQIHDDSSDLSVLTDAAATHASVHNHSSLISYTSVHSRDRVAGIV